MTMNFSLMTMTSYVHAPMTRCGHFKRQRLPKEKLLLFLEKFQKL